MTGELSSTQREMLQPTSYRGLQVRIPVQDETQSPFSYIFPTCSYVKTKQKQNKTTKKKKQTQPQNTKP